MGNDDTLSGITCLPLPEQACIQLVTGPLHCQNCGKAFSSPKCELSYRLLPWNPEMENFVGAPTGIEPASPSFRAGVLTIIPFMVPSVSNLLVPIIHSRWCCNMMLLLQCLHTVRTPPILLYRHYSPDQLISIHKLTPIITRIER